MTAMETVHPSFDSLNWCVRSRCITAVLAGWVMSSASGAPSPEAPVLSPVTGPWSSVGFNLSEKTRRSVSGIACPTTSSPSERVCLVVFDEGIEARHAVLHTGTGAIVPEVAPIRLLPAGEELDAEGAATDGKFFYVVGSHSVKRSDCAANPDSRHVIRFPVDSSTGRSKVGADAIPVGYQESGRIWEAMSSDELLKRHVGKCLGNGPLPNLNKKGEGDQGINIEGLAVKSGRLYFGFRGPSHGGVVPIFSVEANALFENGPLDQRTVSLDVGKGRGVRDMTAVEGGFLLLVGPNDDQFKKRPEPSSMIQFWDGTHKGAGPIRTRQLAHLDVSKVRRPACDKETKPEAITVLSQSPTAYKVLVLSDGLCDGGPLVFDIKR